MLRKKQNKSSYFYVYIFFLILYSCFKIFNCEIKFFPENFLSGDEIFTSPKPRQKLEQIYKAGFFFEYNWQ